MLPQQTIPHTELFYEYQIRRTLSTIRVWHIFSPYKQLEISTDELRLSHRLHKRKSFQISFHRCNISWMQSKNVLIPGPFLPQAFTKLGLQPQL